MESLSDDPILKFNKNVLEDLRKAYNLDKPEALKASIDNLEEWAKKQNHFRKKDFGRDYLERTLISNKGSVEKSKGKIDKLCTLRGLMPKYFGNYDLKKDYDFEGIIYQTILPKMTSNNTRVYLMKNYGQQFKSNVVEQYFKSLLPFIDYLLSKDYSDGIVFVFDYTQVNLTDLAMKMSLFEAKELYTIVVGGYNTRVAGIHFISSSKLIELIVTIMKKILTEKLGNRIVVHPDIDSFHKYVPKDMLPSDYGGPEKTLKELHYQWVDVLTSKEAMEFRASLASATTDEALRPRDKFNEEYMGLPGSFRSFSVD